MSADLAFWLSLLLKMAVTAGFVVAAAMVTERAGPVIGALVATLPIAAAPAYFFLALDHDAQFIAQSALGSMAAHPATGVFAVVYAALAQRHGTAVSVAGALGSWLAVAVPMRSVAWTFPALAAVNLSVFAVCVGLAARYRHASMPPVERRWYDVPLRAGMVAALVAAVVGLSNRVGPTLTGLLAIFPIVMTCLMLIFHPRVGGPATAVLIGNTLWGLVGLSVALFVLHLVTVPLGTAAGLSLALATSVAWNFGVWRLRRRFGGGPAPHRP
jgi:hypothetical protein